MPLMPTHQIAGIFNPNEIPKTTVSNDDIDGGVSMDDNHTPVTTSMRKSSSAGSRSRVEINPIPLETVILPRSMCQHLAQSSKVTASSTLYTKKLSSRETASARSTSTCSTSTRSTASKSDSVASCSLCPSSNFSNPKQQIFPFLDLLRKLHVMRTKRKRNRRLSQHLIILRQARIECELAQTQDARSSRTELLHRLGPMGVALFSPLDGVFEYDTYYDEQLSTKGEDGATSSKEADLENLEEEAPQVSIHLEDESTLQSSPHLLTPSLMQEIHDQALPSIIKGLMWKRLYSFSRDGGGFSTFLRMVQGHKFTLVVVKTACENIIGGFVDSTWEQRRAANQQTFYGSGQSFLFAVKSSPQDGKNQVEFYKWTGENHYNQFCDVHQGRIAMGGGGGFDSQFGFCVEDYFARGSTGPCETFQNEPLVEEGYFDVLEFEVYGFIQTWC